MFRKQKRLQCEGESLCRQNFRYSTPTIPSKCTYIIPRDWNMYGKLSAHSGQILDKLLFIMRPSLLQTKKNVLAIKNVPLLYLPKSSRGVKVTPKSNLILSSSNSKISKEKNHVGILRRGILYTCACQINYFAIYQIHIFFSTQFKGSPLKRIWWILSYFISSPCIFYGEYCRPNKTFNYR